MAVSNSPLLGNERGHYKLYIVGNSGTGKSTLGAYISTKLDLPHISLDQIAWQPGWQKRQPDEFKGEVSAWMERHDRGWIIDGNCRVLGTLIPDAATDIIWLDPPLRHYLPRLVWRTLMRILGFRAPCAEGCEEAWGEMFSSDGIVWFCITHHGIARTRYAAWLARMSVGAGGKMRRLDESRGELARWKEHLKDLQRS